MHPIFSIREFESIVPNGNVLLVDARGGLDAHDRYLAGHLPNAVFVDLETELSQKPLDANLGGRHPLPDPEDFCRLAAQLGITPQTLVVVYDDKKNANAAARFWWMLRAIGHQQVAVLEGDYHFAISSGWKSETGMIERRSTLMHYQAHQWDAPLATIDGVENGLDSGNAVVIDVREKFRFLGESEPIDLVAGHIPGAVNIPYVETVSEEGKLRSAAELRSMYAPYFVGRQPQDVIVHCGSGVTACHTLLALEVADLPGARLYVGSWSEWSRNEKPVAKG